MRMYKSKACAIVHNPLPEIMTSCNETTLSPGEKCALASIRVGLDAGGTSLDAPCKTNGHYSPQGGGRYSVYLSDSLYYTMLS